MSKQIQYLREHIDRIHLIPYAHQDHAWTNSRTWHIFRYLEGFCEALDIMRENPEYTLSIDNILHGMVIFERFCPSRIDEMRDRVLQGRISVMGGGMALVRPTNSGDELYIRNIVTGRQEFDRRFPGVSQRAFLNADTSVGHSQLPQILALCCYEMLRAFRPEGALDCKRVPRECVWKGLDGTELLLTRSGYGGYAHADYCEIGEPDEAMAYFYEEEIAHRIALQKSRDLYLNMGGDDSLPLRDMSDRPADTAAFIKLWNQNGGPEMSFSTPDRYLDYVDRGLLPVVSGVLDGCELSYNAPFRQQESLWYHRFEGERQILTLERLAAIAESAGLSYNWKQTEELWLQLMGISGHAMEFLLDEDYDHALHLGKETLYTAGRLIRGLAERIAAGVQRTGRTGFLVAGVSGTAGKVIAELRITTAFHVGPFTLFDGAGAEVPYQITGIYLGDKDYVGRNYNEVTVAVEIGLPELGYTTLELRDGGEDLIEKANGELPFGDAVVYPNDPAEHVIDNGVLNVKLRDGAVHRVETDGRTVYDCTSDGRFGSVRFYRTEPMENWTTRYDEIGCEEFSAKNCALVERGPVRWRYVSEGTVGSHPATVTLTINKNDPVLRYDVLLYNGGGEGFFAAAFPGNENILAGIPFGAEPRDPAGEIYAADQGFSEDNYLFFERACRGMFFAKHFAAFDLRGNRAAILQGSCGIYYRSMLDRRETELILMKNFSREHRTEHWTRKIGRSIEGRGEQRFSFGFAILPKDTGSCELHAMSAAFEFPPVSAVAYGYDDGNLPFSLETLDTGELRLSAVYKEDDEYVLRVFSGCDRAGTARLKSAFSLGNARLTDLTGKSGENGCKLATGPDNAMYVSYDPWKIINMRLNA